MPRLLPFDYLDKLCFAGTLAPWASGAPTWRLQVRGRLTEGAVRTATGWLLERYPVLASRVVPLSGRIDRARRFAWALDERPDVDQALVVADLSSLDAGQRAAAEQAFLDRFLDLGAGYPFVLTWARLPGEHSALFLQQHHGIADGRAFLGLCQDLVRFLDQALQGAAVPPPAEAPFARLPELSAVPGRGLARAGAFLRGLGHALAQAARGFVFPPAPLRCNAGTDYTGHNRTRFLVVPEARLAGWRDARERLGLSTNDVLTALLAAALARWSDRHRVRPGRARFILPLDTRPRDVPFVSFANHLSSFLVTLELCRPQGILDLARTVARQTGAQRRQGLPHKKLLVEAPVALATPIHLLRRIIFNRPRLFANYSFSNLIPLGAPGAGADGRWRGQGFEVETLRVTTPCTPPQGANTTVVRYGGSLCFNFNYKDSVMDDATAADLCATFEEALAEADRALATGDTKQVHVPALAGSGG